MAYFPVFLILLVAGIVALWFLCAFLFRPLGKFFRGLWRGVEEATSEDKEKIKKSEKE